MNDLDAARKVVEECQHTPRRISLDKMSGACADCIAAHVRAVVEEKEAEWRTVLESSQARHMAMITDLRAALAKSVESNQARERILNQKGLDMLRLEHDLAERTEELYKIIRAFHDLADTSHRLVREQEKYVATLHAERDRLKKQLAQALVAWAGLCRPDADEFAATTDFKTWEEIKALVPEAEREKKP